MEMINQTNTASAPATAMASLVIFGLDEQKKPHASAFALSETDVAQTAAASMGMTLFHSRNEEEHALAAQLPRGRIFASGKAFVPFVAAGVYERLCEFAGVTVTELPETQQNERPASVGPDDGVAAVPADRARGKPPSNNQIDLKAGAMVLACEENRDHAFYEAIVVRIDGEIISLRWDGYPKLPIFKRRWWQVSPLPERQPYW